MRASNTSWSVYLLECGDGTLYCGVAVDVARRIADHGTMKGARYVRSHGGVKHLRWSRNFASRSIAQRVEIFMKRATRAHKLSIANNESCIPTRWTAAPI